jgi:hypothetical protein
MRRLSRTASETLKFVVIMPIANWERELLEAFHRAGDTKFVEIHGKPFLGSRAEWLSYREENSRRIRFELEETLQDSRQPKIIFCYLSDFHVDSKLVEWLRRPNTFVANFNWDDVILFSRTIKGQRIGVGDIARAFDINLTFSRIARLHYIACGARVSMWRTIPRHFDVFPALASPRINRVLFVGARYGVRPALVEALRAGGITVDCFGSGWNTRVLRADEYSAALRNYALTLGNSNIGLSTRHSIVKGRDFEVPLNGGLYLTSESPDLARHFRFGCEVLTYRSFDEAVATARAVLHDPTRFEGVRAAGHVRAWTHHTWDSKVAYLSALAFAAAPEHGRVRFSQRSSAPP